MGRWRGLRGEYYRFQASGDPDAALSTLIF